MLGDMGRGRKFPCPSILANTVCCHKMEPGHFWLALFLMPKFLAVSIIFSLEKA